MRRGSCRREDQTDSTRPSDEPRVLLQCAPGHPVDGAEWAGSRGISGGHPRFRARGRGPKPLRTWGLRIAWGISPANRLNSDRSHCLKIDKLLVSNELSFGLSVAYIDTHSTNALRRAVMYRIRSSSGEEAVFKTLEEFNAAVRSGIIAAEDEIFHSRANKWLDVRSHSLPLRPRFG